MGLTRGETGITLIMTAVEFLFNPNDATKMAKMRIQKFGTPENNS
jgi:hypothetical protein